MHFKVIFHFDGSGIYCDPNEPIHLDGLLAWALAPKVGVKKDLQRDDVPDTIPLPLLRQTLSDGFVWRASALFPEGSSGEDLQFWRKRFRQRRGELATGSPNLTNGQYREWNMPMPMLLTRQMTAYASGNRKECKKLLREITHLGKKRAHGHGKVIGIDLEKVEQDWSLVKDGLAMRWLPDLEGTRLVRLQPPYWNAVGRVRCCEVGDTWIKNTQKNNTAP